MIYWGPGAITGIMIAGGLVLLAIALWVKRRARAWLRLAGLVAQMAAIGVLTAFIGVLLIPRIAAPLHHLRPIPGDTRQALFAGVTYIRDVRREPRPLIIHVITIDLDTPGLRFLVTPGDPKADPKLTARTTSQFLDEFDAQLAINGDFFDPLYSVSILDYYPHTGDAVQVRGFASSQGVVYSKRDGDIHTLYLSADNTASFDRPGGGIYNAISGNYLIVERGQSTVEGRTDPFFTEPHPRTAVALGRTGRVLILIVIDGRQPGYSEGATMADLVDIALEYGGYTVLNLDGGGSATLVMEGEDGRPRLLNSPIDHLIAFRERPVANHLGVYAPPTSH